MGAGREPLLVNAMLFGRGPGRPVAPKLTAIVGVPNELAAAWAVRSIGPVPKALVAPASSRAFVFPTIPPANVLARTRRR